MAEGNPYENEIDALADENKRLREPITWQDVRLHAGEGKLSASAVLQAVNAVLRAR